MGRLTDTNMTARERTAFRRLVDALGFAPRVYFGRDNGNAPLLDRVREEGTPTIYAIAVGANGQGVKKGVREFRLLIAPVPVRLANGTRPHPKKARMSPASRAHISAGMKAMYAKRRATAKSYAPAG